MYLEAAFVLTLAVSTATRASNANFSSPANLNQSQYTKCNDGESIFRSDVCDGIPHCSDGSDEEFVGSGFKCVLASTAGSRRYSRRCLLPQAMVADDVTDCYDGSDACFDADGSLIPSRCFRCLDGSKVISLTQVCDGVIDCPDLSDECLCMNLPRKRRSLWRSVHRNPICSQMRYTTDSRPRGSKRRTASAPRNPCNIGEIACERNAARKSSYSSAVYDATKETDESARDVTTDVINCVTTKQVCNGITECPLGDDEQFCSKPNHSCSGGKGILGNFCDGRIDCPNFDDECSPDCWLRHDYCDDVISGQSNTSIFPCQPVRFKNTSHVHNRSQRNYVTADDVCDGVINCNETANDETNCLTSTHFYCREKSPLFISWTQHYDSVRDCDAGSDECGRMLNSSDDSLLRDRDALIRNPILIIFVWVMGIMALGGNAVVLWQTSGELWKDRRLEKLGKLAKCNRIFVINLGVADFLMGVYLITIGTEAAATDGKYCARDRVWRSSSTCVALGFINQVSSQTSVFMLLLMTSFRLYGTLNPFKVEKSSTVKSSVFCCAILWTTSITIALIPLAKSLTYYFAESIWLPLAFIPNDRVREREMRGFTARANTLTYNTTGNLPDLSWQTMTDLLHRLQISGIHPKWNYKSVKPFGHYNWYPNCIPNLYPRYGDTAWAYSAAIIIFNFCAFCYITIAYVVIYKASSRPSVRKSVRKRSRQWRNDNKKMQRRIFFLVTTDVMCWLPICVLFLLNITRTYRVRRGVVDITGAVLLPLNSAINPLIYSNALWTLFELFRDKICPRRPRTKFLPFTSFRNKLGSASSNENISELKVKRASTKRRTVRFVKTEESTDISATESVLMSNAVTLGSSVDINKETDTKTEDCLSENKQLCNSENKEDYDAATDQQSCSGDSRRSRTDTNGSMTKEIQDNGIRTNDGVSHIERETMI